MTVAAAAGTSAARPEAGTDEFLARHWSRPLASQGTPPRHLSAIESSLVPDDCGACHAQQLRDWQSSFHARAMGPGVLGQLAEMAPEDRASHQACLRCHAPLAEQADSLAATLAAGTAGNVHAGAAGLHRRGLVCAACHVRGYRWYGPPPLGAGDPTGEPAHGGFEISTAFSDSRFCSACHQFTPQQFSLNGKLLENTYEEWRDSPYAEDGITCQSCHMPGRRHLWRGIHDPETVRWGVSVEITGVGTVDGLATASIRVTNSGTGHYFPTYVTPEVLVEAVQVAPDGHEIDATRVQHRIARRVPLDLSREISDTRLAPMESRRYEYGEPLAAGADALITRLRVRPDAFYERFFAALLEGGSAQRGRRMIEQAFDAARRSSFVVHEARHELGREP